MLWLIPDVHLDLVAHAYDALPEEACGLLAAPAGSLAVPIEGPAAAAGGDLTAPVHVERFYRCVNAAASSKLYTVEPRDMLRADRDAEASGLEIVGVMHSHTHTDAYPSPTDVEQAPDPAWHYLIVSLREAIPMVRSYRIVDGVIHEEPVAVTSR